MEIGQALPVEKVKQSRLPQVDFNNIPFGKIYSDHMLVAEFKNGQWDGGKIIPFGDLPLSPATSTIHYGQSIFEGLKAYKSETEDKVLLFRPDENFKRFNESATRLCMPHVPEEVFMDGLFQLVNLDREWVPNTPGCSLYIRPFMFAADAYLGLKPSDSYKFLIITSPVGDYYAEPVRVKIERHYTRAAKGGTGYAKCAGNYAASIYPAKLAQEKGYHQLLWTDGAKHEFIEEAGSMNVMFVIGDKLITAPAGDSILHGITRKTVLTLAKEWGMEVEERPVEVKEVLEAVKNGTLKEAFGTGTAATIAHIIAIGDDGTDYELPAIETREFSNKVLKELTGIQRGNKEDAHNWIFKI
ncbi:branched-chain amino acid aminotransferase [Rapidithrix thailandica]|uniref:branched-chain-amino-acid transaminase n=1 Tax=Rapidithrix thailandica TaxID=413964 RepID=A0AAW9S1M6_9BACT